MLGLSEIIKQDEPLKLHCSYRTGGNARYFAEPKNNAELLKVWGFLKNYGVKYTIIGNGSNVLFDDDGYDGLVISLKKLNRFIILDGEKLIAGSGVTLDDLVSIAVENHLAGIERLSGIPGTVGGAIYMNAGAFDVEIKDVVESVEVFKDGIFKVLKRDDISFSYRKSSITDEIVTAASFSMKYVLDDLFRVRLDILKRRDEKQPLDYPSCGSVFKRPIGTYAGKLIEECGLKGFSIGGAKISEKHGNFIINYNNATSKDIKEIIEYTKKVVFEKTGIMLEEEVKIIEK
jgi:UDP-N-acetylmuramate dehydrogenase